MTAPLFTAEGPEYYAAAYQHNAPFAKPGPYQTRLSPDQEKQFRLWVSTNRVPFNPDAQIVDYDMRGYWLATGGQWSGGHFPDTYKTPYDTTFSRESKYATPDCPFVWQGDSLIDTRDGSLIFGTPVAPASRTGPARDYFIRHPNGSETPVQLVRMAGDKQWRTPADVPVRNGDRLISRPRTT